jgi:hypothetical protein
MGKMARHIAKRGLFPKCFYTPFFIPRDTYLPYYFITLSYLVFSLLFRAALSRLYVVDYIDIWVLLYW